MANYFKNDSDYSCVAYMGSKQVNTMMYVHDVSYYAFDLAKKGIEWSVINIYVRREPRPNFLKRIYRKDYLTDGSIPSKPRY